MSETYKISLIFSLVFFTAVLAVIAQEPAGKFVSGKGRFQINLPAQPSETKYNEFGRNGPGKLDGFEYTWEKAYDYRILVQFTNLYSAKQKISETEQEAILESNKAVLRELVSETGRQIKETELKKPGYLGSEYEIDVPRQTAVGRLFVIDKKSYFLTVNFNQPDRREFARKILDSFRYLTEDEQTAQLVIEAMPEPLPQTTVIKKPASDARDMNLKGRVKNVIIDSRQNPKAVRKREKIENFDQNGMLVSETDYIKGLPFHISAWGYIDGFRVKILKSVEYDDLLRKLGVLQEDGPPAPGKPSPDPRYSYRFEYKYDENGRQTENRWIHNNGKLWLVYYSKYKGNERENWSVRADGNVNSRSVEILGENGDPLEENWFDDDGAVSDTMIYEYKRDRAGNWIERKSFEKEEKAGKFVLELSEITYRTISYYD